MTSLAHVSFDDDGDPPGPRRKLAGMIVFLAGFGLALGLIHLYVGQRTTAVALFLTAAVGAGLWLAGVSGGLWMLAAVWSTDVIGGTAHAIRFNRALRRLDETEPRRVASASSPPLRLLN